MNWLCTRARHPVRFENPIATFFRCDAASWKASSLRSPTNGRSFIIVGSTWEVSDLRRKSPHAAQVAAPALVDGRGDGLPQGARGTLVLTRSVSPAPLAGYVRPWRHLCGRSRTQPRRHKLHEDIWRSRSHRGLRRDRHQPKQHPADGSWRASGPFRHLGKAANFKPQTGHCGFEIKRNEKLILHDEGSIADLDLVFNHHLLPPAAPISQRRGLAFVPRNLLPGFY